MKHLLTALSLLVAPMASLAGDPCPIPLVIHDLGSPHWLDNAALVSKLESRAGWLGFNYRIVDEGLEVITTYRGSPMQRAGILAGSTITSINGQPPVLRGFDSLSPDAPLTMTILDENGRRDVSVTPAQRDPVPWVIMSALFREDCRDVSLGQLSAEERVWVAPYLYDANRRFRCDDAHEALSAIHDGYTPDVYILRGSRRIILTMPGWATTCINASDLDGANLTDENALAVINRVIGDYVADRHRNP